MKSYKRIFKEDRKYIASELNKLLPADEHGIIIQFSSSSGKTKNLKLNKDFIIVFNNFVKSLGY